MIVINEESGQVKQSYILLNNEKTEFEPSDSDTYGICKFKATSRADANSQVKHYVMRNYPGWSNKTSPVKIVRDYNESCYDHLQSYNKLSDYK